MALGSCYARGGPAYSAFPSTPPQSQRHDSPSWRRVNTVGIPVQIFFRRLRLLILVISVRDSGSRGSRILKSCSDGKASRFYVKRVTLSCKASDQKHARRCPNSAQVSSG